MKFTYGNNAVAAGAAGRQRGVSLIELMVAMVIGLVLIGGAVYVYNQSRNNYTTNDVVARLQENGRFAMSVIEPDIRMSNYWGLVKGASAITGQAPQTAASLGAPTACGTNFTYDLNSNLEGNNNEYDIDCAAEGGGAIGSSDTLTIRRASTVAIAGTENDRLTVCSTRVMGRLLNNNTACTAAPNGQVNPLVVNTYYVARESDLNDQVPALRRWRLPAAGEAAALAFVGEEVIAGIEDMQVQFGIDPTGARGIATQYVNPDAVPADSQVVSVRIWLLVRSEARETGFVDGQTYEYGDRAVANGVTDDLDDVASATMAYRPNDGFRRILMSRTIQIRNAIGT
jgi:type IV pilus assembly protein PilW